MLARSAIRKVAAVILAWKIRRDTQFEYGLCLLLVPDRLRLPEVDLSELFVAPDHTSVAIQKIPRGTWSSPVVDLVLLCKLVALAKPKRVLELGSFRGYSAYGIASHLDDGARLVTVDCDPNHGEAYRDTPLEARIERRVGYIAPELFAADPPGQYDFIFIDADHRYGAVKHDTETVLPLLAPGGWIVWHDYANWGFFNGGCGVPEYLAELSKDRLVVHLSGSNMAMHRPCWSEVTERSRMLQSIKATTGKAKGGPWRDDTNRP